jgi:hypothetical protein
MPFQPNIVILHNLFDFLLLLHNYLIVVLINFDRVYYFIVEAKKMLIPKMRNIQTTKNSEIKQLKVNSYQNDLIL